MTSRYKIRLEEKNMLLQQLSQRHQIISSCMHQYPLPSLNNSQVLHLISDFICLILLLKSFNFKVNLELLSQVSGFTCKLFDDRFLAKTDDQNFAILKQWVLTVKKLKGDLSYTDVQSFLGFYATLNNIIPKIKIDKFYPKQIHIETQSRCNAKCTFCEYTNLSRKGIEMPMSLIDKILEELSVIPSNHSITISPYKVSEPFLDRRLPLICSKIINSHPGAVVTIVSNGNYAPKETFQEIFNNPKLFTRDSFSKIRITFSLNTCDESEYESLMGLKFRKTIDNLNWIHSYFRALEVKPNIRLSRVSTSPGGDKNFIQYCSKNFPDFKLKLLKLNDWAGENPLLRTYLQNSNLEGANFFGGFPCHRWQDLSISSTGEVSLCCMDSGESSLLLGSVAENNCLDLYRAKVARFVPQTERRVHSESPCSSCTYYQGSSLRKASISHFQSTKDLHLISDDG